MKENVARPDAADRHRRACRCAEIEETDGGGLRIGALVTQQPTRLRPARRARATRCSPARSWPAPRRSCATWRTDRRQPAAAHALLLLLRHRHAMQQARARLGLRRDRRRQPHPRHPRRQRALHRHASVRHVRGAGGARGAGARHRAAAASAPSRSPISTACRATSRDIDNTLGAGELITAVELPPEGFARALHLPEAARPPLLCVRARVGRGGARAGRRPTISRRAPRAGRRRAQAVARPRGGGSCWRPAGRRRRASRARPTLMLRERAGPRPQRLQDRAGTPRDRARARSGGGRHAAVAERQAHRVRQPAMTDIESHRRRAQPRRRPRQGHRRGEVRRRVHPRRPGCMASSSRARSPRAGSRPSTRADGAARCPACSTSHAREPARTSRVARHAATTTRSPARLTVPAALRRQDPASAASRSRWSSARRFEAGALCGALVGVEYEREAHATDLQAQRAAAYEPKREALRHRAAAQPARRCDAGLRAAPVQDRATQYHLPIEHHNPMEMHATTVVWEGDGQLTVHDKTQGVAEQPGLRLQRLRLRQGQVRVLSPYVGGAFGSGLRPQYQLSPRRHGGHRARALGTRRADPPADVHLRLPAGDHPEASRSAPAPTARCRRSCTRRSPIPRGSRTTRRWSSTGRPALPAATMSSGRLQAGAARPVHAVRHARAGRDHRRVRARDCAMDELAYAAGIDPLELRLLNYAETDQIEDKPFTQQGAARLLRARVRSGSAGRSASRAAALDARRPRAGRLGHGHRRCGRR